jgi:caffeoyl-CoA O-methyltransferase
MTLQIVNEQVEMYMREQLTRHDEPVVVEMEDLAAQNGFPIINRHVGVTVEILARAIGARRIFELGSGYGYSAYWFARAAGPGSEVHCTDGDADNQKKAEDFLGRAGLWDRITFHVGDAVTSFNEVEGDWDIVYCDIDKHGYPEAWKAARDRVKIGGLYICDNVLWSGRVAENKPDKNDNERLASWTEAIVEHNAMISADKRYLSSIVPIRDGVMVALRVGD